MKLQITNIQLPKSLYNVVLRIHKQPQKTSQYSLAVQQKKSPFALPSEALRRQSYGGQLRQSSEGYVGCTSATLCAGWEGGLRGIAVGVIILAMLSISTSLTLAQSFTQTLERTARFENPNNPANELKVYNIHGDVTVEGYDGDEIQISAYQQIEGNSREIVQGRNELKFIVEQKGKTIYIYLDAPFISFKQNGYDFNYYENRIERTYNFLHNITVRVPRNSRIYASTINRGTVTVKETTRSIEASNVNGGLDLSGIAGQTKVRTVNGDINIQYAKNPDEDSEYHTVNGTIKVYYPDDLSADIRFKSLHGEFYTNFKNVERLQARVKTDRKQKGSGIHYKVDKFSPIRIGNGGPTFNFEVLNGDVYIKRIQS